MSSVRPAQQQQQSTTTNIYILKLEGGRYYVGKSVHLLARLDEHLDGNGSEFTRMYKPVELVFTLANASHFDEDRFTKEYMAKYGIANVRGGAYASVNLDDTTIEFLQREIWHAQDRCMRCGNMGHFVTTCFCNANINGRRFPHNRDESPERIIVDDDEDEDDDEDDDEDEDDHDYQPVTCYTCGKYGHYANTCAARY